MEDFPSGNVWDSSDRSAEYVLGGEWEKDWLAKVGPGHERLWEAGRSAGPQCVSHSCASLFFRSLLTLPLLCEASGDKPSGEQSRQKSLPSWSFQSGVRGERKWTRTDTCNIEDCHKCQEGWLGKSLLRRRDSSWDLKVSNEPPEEKGRNIPGRVNSICKDPEASRNTWEEVILAGK